MLNYSAPGPEKCTAANFTETLNNLIVCELILNVDAPHSVIVGEMFIDKAAKCLLPLPERLSSASRKLNDLNSHAKIGPIARVCNKFFKCNYPEVDNCSPVCSCTALGESHVLSSHPKNTPDTNPSLVPVPLEGIHLRLFIPCDPCFNTDRKSRDIGVGQEAFSGDPVILKTIRT
jgi:hypothetical protein